MAALGTRALGTRALVFTLQSHASRRGELLGVVDGGRPYALGFRRASHARRLAEERDPARRPVLVRGPAGAGEARLVVPVLIRPRPALAPPLAMRAVPLDSFLAYPSEHGLGVVIVQDGGEDEEDGGAALAYPAARVLEPDCGEGGGAGDADRRRRRLVRMMAIRG